MNPANDGTAFISACINSSVVADDDGKGGIPASFVFPQFLPLWSDRAQFAITLKVNLAVWADGRSRSIARL